ncbi:hypothetical protein YC2023_013006 [Brassica napus]
MGPTGRESGRGWPISRGRSGQRTKWRRQARSLLTQAARQHTAHVPPPPPPQIRQLNSNCSISVSYAFNDPDCALGGGIEEETSCSADNIPILESKCLFRSNSPIKERAGHIIQPLLERKLREKRINCNAQNTQDLKPMHSEQKCIR